MSEQGSGNIAYSFNKDRYYKIISKNISTFNTYYCAVILISFFFLTGSFLTSGISLAGYITKSKNENGKEETILDRKNYNWFSEYCLGSPYNIISMHRDGIKEILTTKEQEEGKEPVTYIGFKQNTYLFLIITNLIGILIIIEALVKNLMSSIIVSFVQENKNNNPYKNPEIITKVDKPATGYINENYSKLMSLSFLFLIPFTTTYVLYYVFSMDRYDIKKTAWIKYYIFISLIIPTILIIFYRFTGHKSITLFDTIDKYIHIKDKEYINFMKQMFNLKFFIIYIFLFIFMIFLSMHWIYGSINKYISDGFWKYVYYAFVIFSIYFIIPKVLSSNAVSTLYNVYKRDNVNKEENEIIKGIQKDGAQSLYDLIVKYNYPCFKK